MVHCGWDQHEGMQLRCRQGADAHCLVNEHTYLGCMSSRKNMDRLQFVPHEQLTEDHAFPVSISNPSKLFAAIAGESRGLLSSSCVCRRELDAQRRAI